MSLRDTKPPSSLQTIEANWLIPVRFQNSEFRILNSKVAPIIPLHFNQGTPMKRLFNISLPIIFFLMLYGELFAQDISKIYLIGSTLIRSTPGEGIRFYDISRPKRPRQRAMVKVEGNHDVAVVSGYMYADNNTDLVIYRLGRMRRPVAVDTIKNVFQQQQVRIVEFDGMSAVPRNAGASGESRRSSSGASTGKGGSLARFAVVGKYLYCIDQSSLKVFDISRPRRPRYKNTMQVAWNIETLFASGRNLFIGGEQGMYIYNIKKPESPEYVSQFTHVRSCDPVVVEGNRAYVTLRGGSRCGGGRNVLDILDISDIRNPRLLQSVPMSGPFGLTVRNHTVLVCDGQNGIVALDTRNPRAVRQIGKVTGIVPHDIILDGKRMIVTAESGFYLYGARNLASPRLQGKLLL
jgi:hypothetical protein